MYLAFVLVLLEEEYYFLAIVLSSGYKKNIHIYIYGNKTRDPTLITDFHLN